MSHLVLSDRSEITDLAPGESFRQAHLHDADAVAAMLVGVEKVVHLGGQPQEADWDVILESNIVGLHTFYEACRGAGVKRVIFASSNHAIGFYSRDRRIGSDHRVRPDTRYGLSKAFGEALSAMYADKHNIGTLSVRIGNVGSEPLDTRRLSIWIHQEDLMQLCEIGFEHPDVHNQIVYGASDNARTWWDNSVAFDLGYRPTHKGEDFATTAAVGDGPADPVGDHFQGGGFCTIEFDGDVEKTRWS